MLRWLIKIIFSDKNILSGLQGLDIRDGKGALNGTFRDTILEMSLCESFIIFDPFVVNTFFRGNRVHGQ